MNKEKTRYRASKGAFKLESQEGEDISDFKKRVKEEYQKRQEIKEEIKDEIKKEQEQQEKESKQEQKPEENKESESSEEKKEEPQKDKSITKIKGLHTIEMPSGEKITCVMVKGGTQYMAMRGKFQIYSNEGEDLPEFEQRAKEEYSKFSSENKKKTLSKKTTSKKIEEQSIPKKETEKKIQKETQEKTESTKSSEKSEGVDFTSWESTMKSYKLSDKEKKQYTEILKSLKSIQDIPIEIRKEAKKQLI